jgi:hypothetical protein
VDSWLEVYLGLRFIVAYGLSNRRRTMSAPCDWTRIDWTCITIGKAVKIPTRGTLLR